MPLGISRSVYEHSFIAEGNALLVGQARDHKDVIEALKKAVESGFPGPEWDGKIYVFEPTRLFAR